MGEVSNFVFLLARQIPTERPFARHDLQEPLVRPGGLHTEKKLPVPAPTQPPQQTPSHVSTLE